MRAVFASALAFLVACDDLVPLVEEQDGGVLVDAGLPASDAGFSDAGDVDAGFFDAGFFDAGFFPGCDFVENPDQPWLCEGDVDVCDPVDGNNDGGSDLLASWSFIDGDEFVVQARLRAPPLRVRDVRHVSVLFPNEPAPLSDDEESHHCTGPTDVPGSPDDPGLHEIETSRLAGAFGIALLRCTTCSFLGQWPPVTHTLRLGDKQPYDRCKVSLGETTPLVEWRVPLAHVVDEDGGVRYSVMAWGYVDALGSGETRDTLWFQTTPTWTTSFGGRSDDEADLVSLCDLTCPLDQ